MMTATKTISIEELRQGLLKVRGAKPISFIQFTTPDMLAKDKDGNENPHRIGKGKHAQILIRKINKVNGIVGFNYDDGVVRRVVKEIASERETDGLPQLEGEALEEAVNERFRRGTSWHRPFIDENGRLTVLSTHKDRPTEPDYLRFMLRGKGDCEYIDAETGETIDEEAVKPFLSDKPKYQNQGLEEPLIFLAYGLNSIHEISIDGEKLKIETAEDLDSRVMAALERASREYSK